MASVLGAGLPLGGAGRVLVAAAAGDCPQRCRSPKRATLEQFSVLLVGGGGAEDNAAQLDSTTAGDHCNAALQRGGPAFLTDLESEVGSHADGNRLAKGASVYQQELSQIAREAVAEVRSFGADVERGARSLGADVERWGRGFFEAAARALGDEAAARSAAARSHGDGGGRGKGQEGKTPRKRASKAAATAQSFPAEGAREVKVKSGASSGPAALPLSARGLQKALRRTSASAWAAVASAGGRPGAQGASREVEDDDPFLLKGLAAEDEQQPLHDQPSQNLAHSLQSVTEFVAESSAPGKDDGMRPAAPPKMVSEGTARGQGGG